MRRTIPLSILIGALVIVSAASAHVSVTNKATKGGTRGTFTVGVPNERPSSATTKVALRIPAGFTQVKPVARSGWQASTQAEEGMTVLTWQGGRITGTADATFRFTAVAPTKAGAYRIPSVQTYEDGQVVRWIGPADAEYPAPVITIGATGAATTPATTQRHTIPGGNDTAQAEPAPTTTGTDTTAATTTTATTTTATDTTATTDTTDTTTETAAAGPPPKRGGMGLTPLFIVFGVISVVAVVGTIAYRRQHRELREEAAANTADEAPSDV